MEDKIKKWSVSIEKNYLYAEIRKLTEKYEKYNLTLKVRKVYENRVLFDLEVEQEVSLNEIFF